MPKTVKVAEVTELEPGERKTVEAEGVSLALFNVDGTYFTIANACTHVGGPLGEGVLLGKEVTCPLHGAQFDVASGKVPNPPARSDVKSFVLTVEGSNVLIEID